MLHGYSRNTDERIPRLLCGHSESLENSKLSFAIGAVVINIFATVHKARNEAASAPEEQPYDQRGEVGETTGFMRQSRHNMFVAVGTRDGDRSIAVLHLSYHRRTQRRLLRTIRWCLRGHHGVRLGHHGRRRGLVLWRRWGVLRRGTHLVVVIWWFIHDGKLSSVGGAERVAESRACPTAMTNVAASELATGEKVSSFESQNPCCTPPVLNLRPHSTSSRNLSS